MAIEHSTPSRRQFLAAAGALAGAAAVLHAGGSTRTIAIPSTMRRPKMPGANERLRIAVIGPGGMGTGHCTSILRLVQQGQDDVEIVALADVCDLHAESAANKCEEMQGKRPATTRDYREILARDDVHGVLIASPEHWHAKHAIDAIAAGKDVYLEKPMTLRLDEAVALRKAVYANPEIIFQVGTQMIMLPKYQHARELINNDALGQPVFSQTSYCRNAPDGEWNYYAINSKWDPSTNLDWPAWCGPTGQAEWDPVVFARWRRYRKYSTGIVGDLLVHQMTPLFLALEKMGWPTRVNAVGGHYVDKAMENHDQVNLNIQFEGGHTMIVAGSTSNEVGLETMIRGHKANMYLGGRHVVIRPERAYVDDIETQQIDCEDIGSDHDALRLNWFSCMRSRNKPESSVDLGTRVMVAVDLATRSMWDGKTYDFDPETMTARAL